MIINRKEYEGFSIIKKGEDVMNKSLTDLGYVNQAMDQLHQKIEQKIQEQNLSLPTRNTDTVFILFLSIGNPDIRARVHHVVEKDLHKAIKNVRDRKSVV